MEGRTPGRQATRTDTRSSVTGATWPLDLRWPTVQDSSLHVEEDSPHTSPAARPATPRTRFDELKPAYPRSWPAEISLLNPEVSQGAPGSCTRPQLRARWAMSAPTFAARLRPTFRAARDPDSNAAGLREGKDRVDPPGAAVRTSFLGARAIYPPFPPQAPEKLREKVQETSLAAIRPTIAPHTNGGAMESRKRADPPRRARGLQPPDFDAMCERLRGVASAGPTGLAASRFRHRRSSSTSFPAGWTDASSTAGHGCPVQWTPANGAGTLLPPGVRHEGPWTVPAHRQGVALPICELWHFRTDGRGDRREIYYEPGSCSYAARAVPEPVPEQCIRRIVCVCGKVIEGKDETSSARRPRRTSQPTIPPWRKVSREDILARAEESRRWWWSSPAGVDRRPCTAELGRTQLGRSVTRSRRRHAAPRRRSRSARSASIGIR
jgi:hypothetical protein